MSYKDIDSVLRDILKTKKLSKEAQLERTLRAEVPEKLDPTLSTPLRSVKRVQLQYLLDMDEVNALIQATEQPLDPRPSLMPEHYPTYNKYEVEALIAGDYNQSLNKKAENGFLRRRSDKKKKSARE